MTFAQAAEFYNSSLTTIQNWKRRVHNYFETNINSSICYHWCKYTLIPSLKTKCVIVMDNARFHKSRRNQKFLNRHGHRILWLPPYSFDLNPIEKK
ncbi:transposase [Psychrobacter sp.]|uniref:transposase n=1 Tax=Psychrobacter sp. TaxID=56811 RepID=UPI003103BA72